jgi:hypothetical protein
VLLSTTVLMSNDLIAVASVHPPVLRRTDCGQVRRGRAQMRCLWRRVINLLDIRLFRLSRPGRTYGEGFTSLNRLMAPSGP